MAVDCPICSDTLGSPIELAEHEARVHGGPYERLRRCSELAARWDRQGVRSASDHEGGALIGCAGELREVLGGH